MNCLEFRRWVGAEPARGGRDLEEHARACAACREYAQQMRILDRRLHRALSVAVPSRRGRLTFPTFAFAPQKRWALAASLLTAVVAASLVWLSFPGTTLAEDVVAHAGHEPESWITDGPDVPPTRLARVLRASGIRDEPKLGRISYARSCWFRGHFVPHLVVRDASGPVMVLLLREETVSSRVRVAEGGYAGVILPAPRGSIAVLAQADARVDAVAARVLQSL